MNTDAQVAAILSGRTGPLGRAIVCEVFAHETGTRLADVVRTTAGLVAVTYRSAPGRVTGDVAAQVSLTDEGRLELAEPYSSLPGRRLIEAITAGKTKLTVTLDPDAWLDRRLTGPTGSPLARARSRRNRLRDLLRRKRDLGMPESMLRGNESMLAAAEGDVSRLAAEAEALRAARRKRRTPGL